MDIMTNFQTLTDNIFNSNAGFPRLNLSPYMENLQPRQHKYLTKNPQYMDEYGGVFYRIRNCLNS